MKKIIISLLALALVSIAFADTTLLGQTGGVQVPNAYVTDSAMISVNQVTGNSGWGSSRYPSVNIVAPIGDIVEVSGSYYSFGGYGDNNILTLGGKVAVPVNLGADLGLGFTYSRSSTFNEVAVYGAVSKKVLGVVATANFKYFEGNSDAYNFSYDDTLLSFSLDKAFSNDVNIGVEYATGNPKGQTAIADSFYTYGHGYANYGNIYCRYQVTDNFKAQLAVTSVGKNAGLVVGGSYVF